MVIRQMVSQHILGEQYPSQDGKVFQLVPSGIQGDPNDQLGRGIFKHKEPPHHI